MKVGDIIKFDIPDPGDLGFNRIRGVGLIIGMKDMSETSTSMKVLCMGKVSLVGISTYCSPGFEVLNETR